MAIIKNSVTNAGGNPIMLQGLDAARPVAGIVGRLYVATDALIIYRDNGSAWEVVASGVVPNLQSVTNVGNVTTNFILVQEDGGAYSIIEKGVIEVNGSGNYIQLLNGGVVNNLNNPSLLYQTDGGFFNLENLLQVVFRLQYTGQVSPRSLGNLITYNNDGGDVRLYRLSVNLYVDSIAAGTQFKLQTNNNAFVASTPVDLIPVGASTSHISSSGWYNYNAIVLTVNDGTDLVLNSVSVSGSGAIVYDVAATIEDLGAVYAP